MWIFNTVKFKIIEKYILSIGYILKSQEGSHIKYIINRKPLIIPKHKEISRWTLNNIFKIIEDVFSLNTGDMCYLISGRVTMIITKFNL